MNIPHPINPEMRLRAVFLLFDSSHSIKNIYNNFQSCSNFSVPRFSSSQLTVHLNFNHIIELYYLESSRPLKMAHQLQVCALNPKSIQQTNMKLCLSIFHENTITTLRHYKEERKKL